MLDPSLPKSTHLHVNSTKLEAPKYLCDICGIRSKEYSRQHSLTRHLTHVHHFAMLHHIKSGQHACSVCLQHYSGSYTQHLKTHFNGKISRKTRVLYEDIEPELMTSTMIMIDNLEISVAKGAQILNIHPETLYEWRRKRTAGIEIGSGSSKLIPEACPVCNGLISKANLATHIRRMHGPKDKHCDICAFTSSRGSTLRDHINNSHYIQRKLKPIYSKSQCPNCFKTFWTIGRHLAACKEKSRLCSECGQCLASFKDLKSHMLKYHQTQVQDVPVIKKCKLKDTEIYWKKRNHSSCLCPICGIMKSDLRKHMQDFHETSQFL